VQYNAKQRGKNMPAIKRIVDSICVAASRVGRAGDVEYRGVHTATREVIFHKHPMSNGTKELAEFLALVHALAHLNNQSSNTDIYSDSEIAILWVKSKNVPTDLEQNENNEEIFNLTERALNWLANKDYTNPLLKWNTSAWGKNPANCDRECDSSDRFQQIARQLKTIEKRANIAIFGKTYPVKEQLNKAGLTWNGKAWIGALPIDKINELKQLCCNYDLQYTIKGDGLKESRLARGSRPLPSSKVAAVMGEGNLQSEVTEILDIENLRHRKHKYQDRTNQKSPF
jgi:ribonuclease HI